MSSLIHFETGDGKTGVIAGYSDGGFFHVVFNSNSEPGYEDRIVHLDDMRFWAISIEPATDDDAATTDKKASDQRRRRDLIGLEFEGEIL
jgi:hypothetical protein